MKVVLVALAVVAVLMVTSCMVVNADNDSEKGQEKLDWLLSESKKRPVVKLNTGQFNDLVGQGPRPYSLIVILTQISGRCGLCEQIRPEYTLLAHAYETARYTPEDQDKHSPAHTIFFVELDASHNYQLFQEIGLTTIPHMVFVKPTKIAKRVKWETLLSDKLPIGQGASAEEMKRLLRGKTVGVEVSIERPPEKPDYLFIVLLLVGSVTSVAFAMTIGKPLIDKYLRNPLLWLVFGLAFYAFCISGAMYNRIREVPFMHVNQDGSPQYIHPSSGTQFGLEGYIIGAINLVCALAMIGLNYNVHVAKTSAWGRNVAILALLGLLHLFFRQLRGIYSHKNYGYNYGFIWG